MTDYNAAELPPRSVPQSVLDRRARANALRPYVARWVDVLGAAVVAARAEQKPDAVRAFVYRDVTPQPGAMDAYEEMMRDESWAARISDEIEVDLGSPGQEASHGEFLPAGEGVTITDPVPPTSSQLGNMLGRGK